MANSVVASSVVASSARASSARASSGWASGLSARRATHFRRQEVGVSGDSETGEDERPVNQNERQAVYYRYGLRSLAESPV
jgi:hypothetical protein